MNRKEAPPSKGFTLVEVLVAVGLMGLVATLAFGPLAALALRLESVRTQYAEEAALSSALLGISADCRQILPQGGDIPFRTIRKEVLGGGRKDILLVWTGAPLSRNEPAATEVFSIAEPGPFRESVQPGLYRWTLTGTLPMDVNPERLDPGKATLLLKGADRFTVSVFDGKEWVEDYSGPVPAGIALEISRKGVRATHVDTALSFQ
jgi:prepilin-type N-terminal cleavage/methylation domain-containing protein